MGKETQTMKKRDDYITVEELADQLRVNPRTIQRIIERKELPAVRVGRQWRFRREWVEDWLKKNTVNKDTGAA